MTFIEAALEILRREGIPLHARDIAEKAVKSELLSHVGKTPEQTMSKRISAAVAKGKGPFARMKPGVFALAEWVNEKGVMVAPGKSKTAVPAVRPVADDKMNPPSGDEHKNNSYAEHREGMGMTDGNVEPQAESAGSEAEGRVDGRSEEGQSRSRRSRNRRSRSRSRDNRGGERRPADAEPSAKIEGESPRTDAGADVVANLGSETEPPAEVHDSRHPRDPREPRDFREPREVREPREPRETREPRDSREPREPRDSRDHRRSAQPERRVREEQNGGGAPEGGRATSVSEHPRPQSGDFAEQVEQLLIQQGQMLGGRTIAQRLRIPGANAEIIVDALLDADNRERHQNGRRPRFIRHKNGWALSARETATDVAGTEEDIFALSARLNRIAERQIQRKLKGLPLGRLTQLVILVLRQLGYGAVEPVSRGREGECHFRVSDHRQGGRFSTAVIVRKDSQGRSVTDADVTALRGSLHHYKSLRGLIVTSGEISPEAIREADIANLPPVAFIDGRSLAQEMVRCGIGVEVRQVQMAFVDDSWF